MGFSRFFAHEEGRHAARRAGRIATAGLLRRRLLRQGAAMIVTLAMLCAALPLVAGPAAPVHAAPADPHTRIVLTKTADGTGHGTASQTFVTTANGFDPGDDGPDDGVVSSHDVVTFDLSLSFIPSIKRTVTLGSIATSPYLQAQQINCPSIAAISGRTNADGSCTFTVPAGASGSFTQSVSFVARDTGGTSVTGQKVSFGLWSGDAMEGQPYTTIQSDPLTVVSAPMSDLVVQDMPPSSQLIIPGDESATAATTFSGTLSIDEEKLSRPGFSADKGVSASMPYTISLDLSHFPDGTVFTCKGSNAQANGSFTKDAAKNGGIWKGVHGSGSLLIRYTIPALTSKNTNNPWSAEELVGGGIRTYDWHLISAKGNMSGAAPQGLPNNGTGTQPGDGKGRDESTADARLGSSEGRPYPNNDWGRATISLYKDSGRILSKQIASPVVQSGKTIFDPESLDVSGRLGWATGADSVAPGTHLLSYVSANLDKVQNALDIIFTSNYAGKKAADIPGARVLGDTWYSSEQKFDAANADTRFRVTSNVPTQHEVDPDSYTVQWSADHKTAGRIADLQDSGWVTGTPTAAAQSVRVIFPYTPGSSSAFLTAGSLTLQVPLVINRPFNEKAADETPETDDPYASDNGIFTIDGAVNPSSGPANTPAFETVAEPELRKYTLTPLRASATHTSDEGIRSKQWNSDYDSDYLNDDESKPYSHLNQRVIRAGDTLTYRTQPKLTGLTQSSETINPTIQAQVSSCLAGLQVDWPWKIVKESDGSCSAGTQTALALQLSDPSVVTPSIRSDGSVNLPEIELTGTLSLKSQGTYSPSDKASIFSARFSVSPAEEYTSLGKKLTADVAGAAREIAVKLNTDSVSSNVLTVSQNETEEGDPITWTGRFFTRDAALVAGTTRTTIIHLPVSGKDSSLIGPDWKKNGYGEQGSGDYAGSSSYRGNYTLGAIKLDTKDTNDGTQVFVGVPKSTDTVSLKNSDFIWTQVKTNPDGTVVMATLADGRSVPAGLDGKPITQDPESLAGGAIKLITPAAIPDASYAGEGVGGVTTATVSITIDPTDNGLSAQNKKSQYNLWAANMFSVELSASQAQSANPWSPRSQVVSSSLAGKVWWDTNRDKKQNTADSGSPAETGIGSVPLSLWREKDVSVDKNTGVITPLAGAVAVARTTTDKNGAYKFDYLHSGDYVVTLSRTDGKTVIIPQKAKSYNGEKLDVTLSASPDTFAGRPLENTSVLSLKKNDNTTYQHLDFGYYLPDPKVTVTKEPANSYPDCPSDQSRPCTVSWKVKITNKGNTTIPAGKARLYDRQGNNVASTSVSGYSTDAPFVGEGSLPKAINLGGSNDSPSIMMIGGTAYVLSDYSGHTMKAVTLPGNPRLPDGPISGYVYSSGGHLYEIDAAQSDPAVNEIRLPDGSPAGVPDGIVKRVSSAFGQTSGMIVFTSGGKLYSAQMYWSGSTTAQEVSDAIDPGESLPKGLIVGVGKTMQHNSNQLIAVLPNNRVVIVGDSSPMVVPYGGAVKQDGVPIPSALSGSHAASYSYATGMAFSYGGKLYVLVSSPSSGSATWIRASLAAGLRVKDHLVLHSVPSVFSQDGKLYGVSLTDKQANGGDISVAVIPITDSVGKDGKAIEGDFSDKRIPDGFIAGFDDSSDGSYDYGTIFSASGFLYRVYYPRTDDSQGNSTCSPQIQKVDLDSASPRVTIPEGIDQDRTDALSGPVFFVSDGELYCLYPKALSDTSSPWELRRVQRGSGAGSVVLPDSFNSVLDTAPGAFFYSIGGMIYSVTWPQDGSGIDDPNTVLTLEPTGLKSYRADGPIPLTSDVSYAAQTSASTQGHGILQWGNGTLHAVGVGSVKHLVNLASGEAPGSPGIQKIPIANTSAVLPQAELSEEDGSPWKGKTSVSADGYTTRAYTIEQSLAPGQSATYIVSGAVSRIWDATAPSQYGGGLGRGYDQLVANQVWFDYSPATAGAGYSPTSDQAFIPRAGAPDATTADGSADGTDAQKGSPAAPLADYQDAQDSAKHEAYARMLGQTYTIQGMQDLVGDRRSKKGTALSTSCRVNSDFADPNSTNGGNLTPRWSVAAPTDYPSSDKRDAPAFGKADADSHTFGSRDMADAAGGFPYRSTAASQMREDACYQSVQKVAGASQKVVYGSIAGHAWQDADGDGKQDPTNSAEKNLPGITVELYEADSNGDLSGDDPVRTATTDQNGHYEFTGLPLGRYRVLFARPSSGTYAYTTQTVDANASKADNSDVAVSGDDAGLTPVYDLSTLNASATGAVSPHSAPHVDAGFRQFGPAVSVSKFIDLNDDWSDVSSPTSGARDEHDVTVPLGANGKPAAQTVRVVVSNPGNEPLNQITLDDTTSRGAKVDWSNLTCTLVGPGGTGTAAGATTTCSAKSAGQDANGQNQVALTLGQPLQPNQSIRLDGARLVLAAGGYHADTIVAHARGASTDYPVTSPESRLAVHAPVALRITKSDEQTGDVLAGARFTLSKCADAQCSTLVSGSRQSDLTTTADGSLTTPDGTPVGAWIDVDSRASASPKATYWKLTETTAPKGYALPPQNGWWRLTLSGDPTAVATSASALRIEATGMNGAGTIGARITRSGSASEPDARAVSVALSVIDQRLITALPGTGGRQWQLAVLIAALLTLGVSMLTALLEKRQHGRGPATTA